MRGLKNSISYRKDLKSNKFWNFPCTSVFILLKLPLYVLTTVMWKIISIYLICDCNLHELAINFNKLNSEAIFNRVGWRILLPHTNNAAHPDRIQLSLSQFGLVLSPKFKIFFFSGPNANNYTDFWSDRKLDSLHSFSEITEKQDSSKKWEKVSHK